jgi:hypothetical protein
VEFASSLFSRDSVLDVVSGSLMWAIFIRPSMIRSPRFCTKYNDVWIVLKQLHSVVSRRLHLVKFHYSRVVLGIWSRENST